MAGGSGIMEDAVDFGEPGVATASSRVIEIKTLDTMRYDLPAIDVKVGETITFRVTNGSILAHEFLLKAGELEYACHVLGHYPAGMIGKVTVN